MDQFKKTHLRRPSKSDSNNSSENDKDDKRKLGHMRRYTINVTYSP
jgi:hypothetical protein